MQENHLQCNGWHFNKVVLLRPQCTNIAQEQMVMACKEPPVLKMPCSLPKANFENALNLNAMFLHECLEYLQVSA